MVDFPDVPDLPGVPAIPRDPNAPIADAVVSLLEDAIGLSGFFSNTNQWGLYLDGEPAITADIVVAFGYKLGFQILTYPIEDGGFESYNKVQRPFDVRLRFSTGGSVADRTAFVASVDQAVRSLDLFDAVTPEAIYSNVNPISMDYNRAAMRGVGLLTIDVVCEQVRNTATTAFSSNQTSTTSTADSSGSSTTTNQNAGYNPGDVQRSNLAPLISSPASPSAAPQVSGGQVQPSALPSNSAFDVNAVVQP